MSTRSIIVASPIALQRGRLSRMVNAHPDFEVIAATSDLMTTYAEVEERRPRAVLIADLLAALPEFEVMHAMFTALDVRWLVIKSHLNSSRVPANTAETSTSQSADLFSIAADAPPDDILRQLLSLTRTKTSKTPNAKETAASTPDRKQPTARPVKTLGDDRIGRSAATQSQSPIILIGASTGGVDALLSVLSHFPVDCPPTLIVQHTGAGFGESLAALLNRQSRPRVFLAADTHRLQRGEVVIGAGTRRHLILEDRETCKLAEGPAVSGHLPSVDRLFTSATAFAPRIAAALLTGMGRDGADGLKALRDAGATTLAQDEKSCVVYGMPRAAIENGGAAQSLPLEKIGPSLLQFAQSAAQPPLKKEMQR